MTTSLLERIKAERQFKHTASNGMTFHIELPTMEYLILNTESDMSKKDFLIQQIFDFEAHEKHFIELGDENTPVEYDVEILNEYLADDILVVNELFNAVTQKATERAVKFNSLKKPLPTSSKSKKLKESQS